MFKGKTLIGFIMFVLILSACSLQGIPAGTEATAPPADDPAPPDGDATPTATLTLVTTGTDAAPIVSVSMDTNCRTGQGAAFDYVGALMVGETAEVLARDTSGHFLYIRNPDGDGYCWIWDEYATILGEVLNLPAYTPMPTPTPMPAFSAVFKNIEQCVTWYNVELEVTNTGEVTWESYQLYLENTSLSLDDTISDDRFADCYACGCDYVDLSLAPGVTGTLGSRPFMDHVPHGESFYAELMLCTQNGLAGQCLTQVLTFTVP